MSIYEKLAGDKIGEPQKEGEREARKQKRDLEGTFRVVEGKRLRGEKRTPIEVVEISKIEEEKVFEKEEIMAIIEEVAKAEGFPKEQLEIEREFQDTKGNLIGLMVIVKPARAKVMGWERISYDYVIKGTHGPGGGGAETLVVRVYLSLDQDKIQPGIVAEYKDGKWILSPGNVLPTAKEVEPTEPQK